jgi:hypothetical protein
MAAIPFLSAKAAAANTGNSGPHQGAVAATADAYNACLTLQGGDYAVAAVQGPGHDRYSNASIGYNYATMSGAQGAQQSHQGMNMNVVSGVDMALVAQLEQMWKEVE